MSVMRAIRCLGLLAATVFAGAAAADGSFYGYAYDLDSGKYLYTEVHSPVFEAGREVSSTIAYFAPDGRKIGHKTLDYRTDPYVPKFRLDLTEEGYAEAITANGERIELLKVSGKNKPEVRKSTARKGLTAADSGFNHLVQDKLPELLMGKEVSFRFVVAGELDSFQFKINQVGEGTFEGRPAVKLLVQADSLLRFVAPDLKLMYDPVSKRLLEYKGVSNLHDSSGKAYNARIVYFSKPPEDAPKNLPPLP